MKKAALFSMFISALCFTSCSDDDDGNGNGNGAEVGTFEATVTGDIEEEISGIAYYEIVDGEIAITMTVSFSEWPFITFLFNPPVEEGTYTAIGTAMDQEDDETNASASNGDYLFLGDGGSVTITNVGDDYINGDFTVNFEYTDTQETVNIVISGSFSAEED